MENNSNLKGEATLLYSGGCDSALAAVYLCEQHKKVTLLTMRSHNMQFFINKAKILSTKLIEKFGENRISHKFIDIRKLWNKILFKNYFRDIFKFGFSQSLDSFCVACGSSLLTAGIIYNLENRIHYLAMGFTEIQSENSVGLLLYSLKFFPEFCREYNIEYLLPVYKVRESDVPLCELGIIPKGNIQSRRDILSGYPFFRPTEATCPLPIFRTIYKQGIAGPVLGTGSYSKQSTRYYYEKREVYRRYIKEYFDKKNIRLEDLIGIQKNLR